MHAYYVAYTGLFLQLAYAVTVSDCVDQFSPALLHHHHHHHLQRQRQQQQSSGEVQWIVVEPRQDLGQVSSDAVTTPAASVTSTPAPVVHPTTEARYGVPGGSAPVVAEIVKDEPYQEDYIITQRNYPAVSGTIICHSYHRFIISRSKAMQVTTVHDTSLFCGE